MEINRNNVNNKDSNGVTCLHQAAMCNNRTAILHYVALGADVNARCRRRWTPLHASLSKTATSLMENKIMEDWFPLFTNVCRSKILQWSENLRIIVKRLVEEEKIRLINCLLEVGADINATFDMDVTSLQEAVRLNRTRAVEVLTRLGLVNAKRRTGVTVVALAVYDKQKEVIKHLVRSGADVNATLSVIPVLHDAVHSQNVHIVKTLLEHGTNIFANKKVGFTLVMNCSFENDTELLSCLAHCGADMNIPYSATLPLHEAIVLNQPDILECLIQHKVGQRGECKKVFTPVLRAILQKHDDFLKLLVQYGADINYRFEHVGYAMVEAVRLGTTEIVRILSRYSHEFGYLRLDIRSAITMKMSALCLIVNQYSDKYDIRSLTQVLKMLSSLGADVNSICEFIPALFEQVESGNQDMVTLMATLGANVNITKVMETNILCLLLDKVSKETNPELGFELLKVVVEIGADINRGEDLVSPILLAINKSNKGMVETLSKLGADLNFEILEGVSPLVQACSAADNASYLVQYFIESGADVIGHGDTAGVTPLLAALSLGKIEMADCLLRCGASRRTGFHYRKVNALVLAVEYSECELVKQLVKAGFDPSKDILLGNVQLEDDNRRDAENLGIDLPKKPYEVSLLTHAISMFCDSEVVETLLSLGVTSSCKKYVVMNMNIEMPDQPTSEEITDLERLRLALELALTNYPWLAASNLHIASIYGNVDMVRLLIVDGADANEVDQSGNSALDLLPLASLVDYQTLHRARSAEKVVERVDFNTDPVLPFQKMDTILSYPGVGDVKCIEYTAEIFKEVRTTVHSIVCGCQYFPNTDIVSCGSAEEGTKVGLPDEMDFLVQLQTVDRPEQNLREAGHGSAFMRYLDQSYPFLKDGSKAVHSIFYVEIHRMMQSLHLDSNYPLKILPYSQSRVVRDSNRRATTPVLFQWKKNQDDVIILIDLVPSILVLDWPVNGVSHTWLMDRNELRENGYYLVPKPPHASSALAEKFDPSEVKELWKISFAHLETYHMQRIDKRVKDVYLLAKCLRNPDVSGILVAEQGNRLPKKSDKYVTSYILKMIFLMNVETFLRMDMDLGAMVYQVYSEVEEGLSSGFIPLFFMPTVNALDGLKMDIAKCAKVAKIMKKFVHALYQRDYKEGNGASLDDRNTGKAESVYRVIEIESVP